MGKDVLVSRERTKTIQIAVLSLGHLTNDMYMNQIQVMIPYMVLAGLSVGKGAFLVSLFTISSSLLQPVFGYLSDKRSQSWLVFTGTLWMSVLLGFLGLTSDYMWMMIIATLAGLGTAAFHPQASAMIASCSEKRKTFVQAIFIASGNIGWALTPLLAVPLINRYGVSVTPVFMIPGLVMSVSLWIASYRISPQPRQHTPAHWEPLLKKQRQELIKIMLIVALRSLTYFSLISFLPLYLHQRGTSLITGSRLMFLMLFAGSLGGLLGGFLADKYGRKRVTMVSLCMTSPLFYLFLTSSGVLSLVFLALAGAFLLATFSVTVTLAHRVIVRNTGLASGLMLGFGTGIGGLGVGLMGMIADYAGVSFAVHLLIWLPLLAGLSAFRLTQDQ